MADYVLKLQEDLRKRLDRLCWMHNEPTLHVVEHFTVLMRQVDLNAERLLSEILSKKCETGKETRAIDVNRTRLEFIRILEELEKRTQVQSKPQAPANEVFAFLEPRIDSFKDSSSSLDDLEDSYLKLAREITNETDRVEKRLLDEQTIIYWPPEDKDQLGSLVYFGHVFLSRAEIDRLISRKSLEEDPSRRPSQQFVSKLLVSVREPLELNKGKQVLESLQIKRLYKFANASKFYCIGKTETEFSGYAAEGSTTIDKEFISYMRTDTDELQISGAACLDTFVNLFDVYPSTSCGLRIYNSRLESLHVNLLPSPVDRLTTLSLIGVHFESFDTTLLSQLTNLSALKIQATFSKDVKFDLEFLRPLRKLKWLKLTLPGSSCDFGLLKGLPELRNLKLESTSFFYAKKRPRLSKADLEQILSLPQLQSLELCCFEIETISREMFNGCRKLTQLELRRTRISDSEKDASLNFGGFPSCYINTAEDFRGHSSCIHSIVLIHSGIRVLNTACFFGMKYLTRLSLGGNFIADLPPGLFRELSSLESLSLNHNLVKHIGRGVFGKLEKLKMLRLDFNPIESIEANALAQLHNLNTLSLSGCRLTSINNEMFTGLECLDKLNLSNNLIRRIEVIAEDRRRINVAKVDLSDDEKELVKKHLFTDLSCLFSLDLSRNKIEKLDLNCFNNLKNVKHLYLPSNLMKELSGAIGPEQLLSKLKTLHLDNNQLTAIDQSALPKSLHGLDLSKNHLKRLDDEFFAKFTKLVYVDLSENELTWTITEATLASCRRVLKHIDFSMNESIHLTEGAFRDMPRLNCILYDFSGPLISLPAFKTLRIRKLTPEAVRALKQLSGDQQDHLRQLHTCYLSGCSIRTLTRNPDWKSELDETPSLGHFYLSWLQKTWHLLKLDLSRNLIETLDDPELFAGFKSMTKISLSGNRLSRIHRDIFKCLPNLSIIDLSYNNLSSIDMGLFRHLKILRDLNLSSNSISSLNLARLFRICPSLQSLNVADNQLDDRSTDEPIDARFLCDLQKLNMANNRFKNLHLIRDMTSLQHLDLRGNQIESVMSNNGENMLGRLFSLTYLDLSGNQIRSLRDEMFTHLCGRLKHLDISRNPLDIQLDSVLSELV